MLDGTIPPEMQERYLKVIAFESTRLEKLTRSLLTLNELDVKKRMMHMRRFDINETIRTTAASFEGTCSERNIRLELLLAGKELFVRADMEQIQQVLYLSLIHISLCTCAFKFFFIKITQAAPTEVPKNGIRIQ